jgi:F-type H+-transporting ATPase subunit delta
MKNLDKNARGFIDGVVKYIKTDSKSPVVENELKTLLSKVSEDDRSQSQATVTSAVTLTENEKSTVVAIIEKIVGHPVELICQVNQDLLGGMRISVGDWVLDTSLKKQLEKLRSYLS